MCEANWNESEDSKERKTLRTLEEVTKDFVQVLPESYMVYVALGSCDDLQVVHERYKINMDIL